MRRLMQLAAVAAALALAAPTPTAAFSGFGTLTATATYDGEMRFSVQLPAWARYNTIVAFAQDVVSGQEVQIPWLCEPGGYECTWY